ncbi:hypothetical protein EJP67_32975 [Variovorax guangxiensis]|uniref:Uncharacterized protein n=1 Tax=Variovorax guangxiensis TaxID=1775474 RepID=A0A3S0XK40_9BURK|nr:hypothetical protein [Variovorax guangxiensis]RUR71871.1 hypothetical protein EJP67_32975 [Variovorax guangxiensis]
MGYAIKTDDGIDRLTLITIRYMGLIGEVLARNDGIGFTLGRQTQWFDRIEHIAQDALEVGDIAFRASSLMDEIYVMKWVLEGFTNASTPGARPSLENLESLYFGCAQLGGEPRMQPPAFNPR